MIRIVYELECHCGETMRTATLDLSNPQPDGSLVIDLEMAAGGQDFECDECGCFTGTGDLDLHVEPEQCPAGDDVESGGGS